MSAPHYLTGLDLGQASDYTAWVVVERSERAEDRVGCYDVRHIDRVRGASYPKVVAHSGELIATLRAQEPRPNLDLIVDYTGVGRPVADMIVDARLDADLRLVTITGGDSETVGDRGERRVPKRNLAGVVQVLLQSGRLRIGESLPLASVLTSELVNFRVKISLTGHDSYGAGEEWREGSNDDLVLALALACWQGERKGSGRIAAPVGIALSHRARELSFQLESGGFTRFGVDPWG
jgi:hypothetical protein